MDNVEAERIALIEAETAATAEAENDALLRSMSPFMMMGGCLVLALLGPLITIWFGFSLLETQSQKSFVSWLWLEIPLVVLAGRVIYRGSFRMSDGRVFVGWLPRAGALLALLVSLALLHTPVVIIICVAALVGLLCRYLPVQDAYNLVQVRSPHGLQEATSENSTSLVGLPYPYAERLPVEGLPEQSRKLRPLSMTVVGVVGVLVATLALFPVAFPDGFEIRAPRLEQGLLLVRNQDWESAQFHPLALLRLNERSRVNGRFHTGNTCIDTGEIRAYLEEALRRARINQDGARALWVSMQASKQFGTTGCRNTTRARGSRSATWLRATSLRDVRPLECTYAQFIDHHLSCPALPPTPKPVLIDDQKSYPAGALGRGVEGRVFIEALIDHKNRVIKCTVIESANDEDLDSAACQVIGDHAQEYAGKGSSQGLASGVRRVRTSVRFLLK